MIYANGARSDIYYVNPKVIICYARFWTLKAYRTHIRIYGHRFGHYLVENQPTSLLDNVGVYVLDKILKSQYFYVLDNT